MLLRNISGAEIARRAGVNRTAIYNVIDGKSKSYRLRKAIADAIGESVEDLWSEDKKDIKIKMRIKCLTGTDIARRIGVTPGAISNIIIGRSKSYRLRKAIADAIGESVEALWPEDKKGIKTLIIIKNFSNADIARRIGVTPGAISHIITGRSKSQKLRKAIADVIGEPVEALWPEDRAA